MMREVMSSSCSSMQDKRSRCLADYADLIVKIGVNLQGGQILVINSPIECASFARQIARSAFHCGASDVVMNWVDEKSEKIRFEEADEKVFSEYPAWKKDFFESYAEKGAAFVSIAAHDPEIFQSVDGRKLKTAEQAAGQALLDYRARLMSNQNRWCVAAVPTEGWAEKVFPHLDVREGVGCLYDAIFQSVHISPGRDIVSIWKAHIAFLQKAAAFMNDNAFRYLRYMNDRGTDLVVELPEGHIWEGGAEMSSDGISFAANLPTEEVYTLPKRDGVNGIVVATKPLNYKGRLVEGFSLVFDKGRVVEYHADEGEDVLKEILETDEGSSFLGEVALVPYDSPISKSGILFYNTLFDENASCHLALGKAYPTCLAGGSDMDSLTLLQHGVNDSLVHEDFMIGTSDLSIIGIKKDGAQVPVFVDGNFAFER